LFSEWLGRVDPGFGVERAILDAVAIEPVFPGPRGWRCLGANIERTAPDLAAPPASSRPSGVIRLKPPAGYRPSTPEPIAAAFGVAGSAMALAVATEPREAEPIDQPVVRETPPRPLRLLRRPEPIEAIAPLADQPPALFRWRSRLHRVVKARGPEAVAPDWWRPPAVEEQSDRRPRAGADHAPRDYFEVEDSEGERFWLFREGRYDGEAATLPRWHLHGIFG
jgi:protein ImuB